MPMPVNPYRNTDGSLIIPSDSTTTFDPSLVENENRMKRVADDMACADETYDDIFESGSGRIINTDLARNLSKEYSQSIESRRRFVHATGRVAQAYVKDRLWRETQKGGSGRILLFLAGGVAAGKTFSVRPSLLREARLVCDGTLRDTKWGVKAIRHALLNDWLVEVSYVQRPLHLVAEGAILRADNTGRWSPYATLPNTHQDAQRSIIRIAKNFCNEPKCMISFALNSGTSDSPKALTFMDLDDIDAGGKYSYA